MGFLKCARPSMRIPHPWAMLEGMIRDAPVGQKPNHQVATFFYPQDVGFMAYNVLAGGMLTGKYLDAPAAPDEPNPMQSFARTASPRGRMDDISWGPSNYDGRDGRLMSLVLFCITWIEQCTQRYPLVN